MTNNESSRNTGEKSVACQVVILHENDQALSRAKSLCERIMEEFWHDLEIRFTNWAMERLTDEVLRTEAAAHAGYADILVVATTGSSVVPEHFMQWAERWLAQREPREGVLVGLFENKAENGGNSWDIQLHRLALRAGMDYLKHLPQTPPSSSIPDITGWCASRAETVTGTLDQIIRNEPKSADI